MLRSLVLATALGLVIAVAPVAAVDDAAGVKGEVHTDSTAESKRESRREKRIQRRENHLEHREGRVDDRLERMREREKGMEDDE